MCHDNLTCQTDIMFCAEGNETSQQVDLDYFKKYTGNETAGGGL